LPWYDAVIVTTICEETALVVMLNLGEVLVPAATITLAGTAAAAGLELDNDTIRPPAGAAAFKVTVAWIVLPPTTLDCPSVMDEGSRGTTDRVAGTAMPL
jgi:hypothetical protein